MKQCILGLLLVGWGTRSKKVETVYRWKTGQGKVLVCVGLISN
jgi:hypothetical protein